MNAEKSTKDVGQLKVRLPPALKQELAERAKLNRRTVTMEVLSRLELSMRADQQVVSQ